MIAADDDSALRDIRSLVVSLLPSDSHVRALRISTCNRAPLPDERRFVLNAVSRRKQEFAAGRACAHDALRDLGYSEKPILVGSLRQPIWPKGVVGSITHDGDYCIAAIMRKVQVFSVGIDLTQNAPISADVVSLICTSSEARALRVAWPLKDMTGAFRTLFSIKESLFKCLCPIIGRLFDFTDANVAINFRSRNADIKVSGHVWRENHPLDTRFDFSETHVASAVWLSGGSEVGR